MLADVAWHPRDPKLLTLDREGTVKVWDTTNGTLIHRLQSVSSSFNRCAGWNPDGTRIFAASGQTWKPGKRGTIEIWDATSYELVARHGDNSPRLLVSWSPVGNRLAAIRSQGDARLEIIDPESGDVLAESMPLQEGWQNSLAFHPSGEVAAIGFNTGKLALLDVRDGSVRHWSQLPGEGASSLQWSPDGTRMAVIASYQGLMLLDGKTGELLIQFDSLSEFSCCGWDSTGADFALISRDGFLWIWSASEFNRQISTPSSQLSIPVEQ